MLQIVIAKKKKIEAYWISHFIESGLGIIVSYSYSALDQTEHWSLSKYITKYGP